MESLKAAEPKALTPEEFRILSRPVGRFGRSVVELHESGGEQGTRLRTLSHIAWRKVFALGLLLAAVSSIALDFGGSVDPLFGSTSRGLLFLALLVTVWKTRDRRLPFASTTPNPKAVKTITFLRDLFGEARFDKIADRYKIDLKRLSVDGVRKQDLEKLFLGAAAFLDTEDLKPYLDSPFEAFDKAYKELLMVGDGKRLERTFLGREVEGVLISRIFKHDDEDRGWLAPIPKSGGKLHDPDSDRERVMQVYTLFDQHRELDAPEPQLAKIRDRFLERMVTRVITHDIDHHVVIPWVTSDGRKAYYQVYLHLVTLEGFYAYAFTPVVWEGDERPQPELMIRSSQIHPEATLMLATQKENCRHNPGRVSARSAIDLIRTLLSDRTFVGRRQQVVGSGYSLGAAQLQYLAAEFPTAFSSLHTFCSPGIHIEDVERFNAFFEAHPEASIRIEHHRNYGDFIDLAGDYFLGYKAPSNVHVSLTVRGFVKQRDVLVRRLVRGRSIEPTEAFLNRMFMMTSPPLGLLSSFSAFRLNHGTEFYRRDPHVSLLFEKNETLKVKMPATLNDLMRIYPEIEMHRVEIWLISSLKEADSFESLAGLSRWCVLLDACVPEDLRHAPRLILL